MAVAGFGLSYLMAVFKCVRSEGVFRLWFSAEGLLPGLRKLHETGFDTFELQERRMCWCECSLPSLEPVLLRLGSRWQI